MACECDKKLQEILQQVEENDGRMTEAAEEGDYWERKVAANFLSGLREKPVALDCDCAAAQKVNTAFKSLQNSLLADALAEEGGGTVADRSTVNLAYGSFKMILTDQPQPIKPVTIWIPEQDPPRQ